jgi:hypothetical protein
MTARARLVLVFPLLLAIFAVGCTKGGRTNTGIVQGTVKYKGTKLGGGTITFWPVSGSGTYAIQISPDGSYMGTDIPPGEMIVTVETESVKRAANKQAYGKGDGSKMTSPAPKDFQPPPAGTYVEIPAKYPDKEKSGLKYTVESGKQTKDWDLTD